jgi:hypothetical protein
MKMILGKTKYPLIYYIKSMKGRVFQFKKAGISLYEKGYYLRGRNYSPLEGNSNNFDLYYVDAENGITQLCYNTTRHRTLQILKLLKTGKINEIPYEKINNYIHNGYLTRSGLFRSKKTERMKQMERSHADYLGMETGNSKLDHENRVRLRNKYR